MTTTFKPRPEKRFSAGHHLAYRRTANNMAGRHQGPCCVLKESWKIDPVKARLSSGITLGRRCGSQIPLQLYASPESHAS